VIVFVPYWIGTLNDTLRLPGVLRDELPLALFGAVFVVAMLVFPHGIQGGLHRLWLWRKTRRMRAAAAEA
jgi:ABC-type branched-subunit amino acid transport system permease subunit